MRKTVSLTLTFSFLTMMISGIILFLSPKGKIAYWSDWTLFGLSKTQWTDIHITSMFLFIIIAGWHIAYNWKALSTYLKNSAGQITLAKRELLIALSINIIFIIGALVPFQPFSGILELNENIKAYWEKTCGVPPYGHAEESSLQTFSRQIGLDPDYALKHLREKGFHIHNGEESLQTIAKNNHVSANTIYTLIQSTSTSKNPNKDLSDVPFLGQKSLQELAEMKKIDLEKSLAYLREKGFNATAETRMKEAANRLGIMPYELYETLRNL